MGRRVNKQVYNSGSYLDTVDAGDFFYYDGHRIIEHHKTIEVQDDDDGGGCVCVEGVCACKSREGLLSESEVSGQFYSVKSGMSDVASPLVGGAEPSRARKEAVQHSTDALYEKLKAGMVARGYSAPNKDSLITYAAAVPDDPPPSTHLEFHLEREFVYGLNYIDEHVTQYDNNGYRQYILQDANYNVVGHTNATGALIEQYAYTPYGEIQAMESGLGTPAGAPSTQTLFEGLWYDRETGLIYARYRYVRPDLGGPLQKDPNETGLVLVSVLGMNGQPPSVYPSLTPTMLYTETLNPYEWVRSNPLINSDPSGLYSDQFDYFAEADELELEITGQKLYTLGAINEGARWASLGLQTSLDVAGALLGVDVLQSVQVLASGQGGFWDAMNIFMSVAPIGHLGKAGGKIAKAIKTGRRAGKGSKLAASAARHLFKILPYKKARKLTAGHGGDIMAHHILEGRHLKWWGRQHEIPDVPAVILTRAQHVRITAELQSKLRTGVEHDPRKVWAVYKQVYRDYPDWLRAIRKYFP